MSIIGAAGKKLEILPYTPLISIVIPVYNKEDYIIRCMESLEQQTFQDYEVILVDDGSTDSSAKVIKGYLADPRIHYIYQENAGVSAARNRGLNSAVGDWIAFVDPDDYLKPEYLEKLLAHITPLVDIVSCCCVCDGTNEIVHFFDEDRIFSGSFQEKKDLFLELMDVNYKAKSPRWTAIGVPWGKIYRRAFLIGNSLQFDIRLFRMQDNIFNMYAFDKCREMVYFDEPLYVYSVDNINGYYQKFAAKAKGYLTLVSKLRYNFLERYSLIKYPDVYRLYCFELLQNTDMMLTKYFLHRENKKTIKEKVNEIREEFTDKLFVNVFEDQKIMTEFFENTNKCSVKIRLSLLVKGRYKRLLCFESVLRAVQRGLSKLHR